MSYSSLSLPLCVGICVTMDALELKPGDTCVLLLLLLYTGLILMRPAQPGARQQQRSSLCFNFFSGGAMANCALLYGNREAALLQRRGYVVEFRAPRELC